MSHPEQQSTDELRAALQANLEAFIAGNSGAPTSAPETSQGDAETPAAITTVEQAERPQSDYVRRSRQGRPDQGELPSRGILVDSPVTRLARARGRQGVKLPKGWMDAFLRALAEVPIVGHACKAAKVSRASAYRYRARVAAFSRLWDLALEDGLDNFEVEMTRRGVKGYQRPVFGSLGAGMGTGVVGAVTEYSDEMLKMALKAYRPERFRERFEIRDESGSELDADIIELARQLNEFADGAPVPHE